LDPRDAIYFTYDRAGERAVEDIGGSTYFNSDAGWADEPKGPDIAFSNGHRSVTRTNSSGWGCAIWSEPFVSGKFKIDFKIDNDGGSDYLYIGVLKVADNYPLSDVINSDNSHGVFTYKRTGEFHRPGSNQTVNDGRYGSGDEISFTIDMDAKTMLCAKNNNDLHTFEGLFDECRFAICFGGSNQHVTITKFEVMGAGSTNVSKKKVNVQSDKVFYHFPVNAGFFSRNTNSFKKEREENFLFSSDCRRMRTKEPLESVINLGTFCRIDKGRFYFEAQVSKLPEGSGLQLGFVPDDYDKAAWLNGQHCACIAQAATAYINTTMNNCTAGFAQGDVVACYYNRDTNTVSFYVNGTKSLEVPF